MWNFENSKTLVIMNAIYTILISAVLLTSCDLYITKGGANEILSENGNLEARGEWKYTKSKKMDQYDFYQKWENSYVEYYENGTVKSTYKSAHKRATYGKPCKEVISHYISYYPSGVKAYEQKDICDCSKSIIISYNKDGKVVEKRVIKTKTKEIKKKKK